jgi:predicted nucleic-acid-binding Zn-ribbon protein
MKESGRCPKCQSHRVGHLEAVVDRLKNKGLSLRKILFEDGKSFEPAGGLRGQTEAYICTECGYFEEYLKEPADVPWENLYGFSWPRGTPPEQGPYRSE